MVAALTIKARVRTVDHNKTYTYHTTLYLQFLWTPSLLYQLSQSLIFYNLEHTEHTSWQLPLHSLYTVDSRDVKIGFLNIQSSFATIWILFEDWK